MNNVRSKEIDIKEYFDVIKRRLWIIIIFTILTTSAGYLYQKFYNNYVPMYEASTRIMLNTKDDLSTLMVMIDDPTVLEKVIDKLQLNMSAETLGNQLHVERIDESTIFSITVQYNDPIVAKNIANETAHSFKDEVSNLLNFKDVQLLTPAKEPLIPINKQSNKVIAFALVLGLVISIGVAFLMDSLDETVKRRSEVEEILGVTVIGTVPNMNKKKLLSEKKKYKILINEGENVDI
ncbi:YveK family protein [Bacillus sp. AFS017336]|uniref:YveK family protein n=1 Tax=Bacillus sp. AFS017336 TaxID=2033489 RepID=UPI000BF15E3F|nr:Wzz/FepE/Etk N-terminal domain-containing protein [Bacillus sp. AFS017336]PEL07043.1 capsular biosynthesis protein [Bacillus sp. AFS017336]